MLLPDQLLDGVAELPSLGQPENHRVEVEDMLTAGKLMLLLALL